jgi:hypothetical protein
MKLIPGDVVGVNAAAKDARGEAHTDISFIQVDPFEREFSQSQQSGGGGGGGGAANDQAQIAQREKEIIAATWKQDGIKNAAAQKAAEQAKFLSDVQTTLRSQAYSLAGRLGMRDLQNANEQFGSFQREMEAAAVAMGPASEQLGQQKWSAAVTEEQKALQHLLRAEATFRQIQVAFGARGGGGGVNSAGRDLASLFDLELDTQKNQYESAQTPFNTSQHAAEIEDALRKLDELARRQSELAAQRNANAEQSAEERWQQEMLRRKADELQQQIEQLARNGGQQGSSSSQSGQQRSNSSQSGQQGSNSSRSSRQGSSGRPQGSQGSQGSSDGQSGESAGDSMAASARQALSRLRQAEEEMRRAVDEHNSVAARRAADQLREAMNLLAGVQQQDISHQLDSLSGQAGRLADEQREQSGRMGALRSGRSLRDPQNSNNVQELIDDRQRLADELARLTRDLRTAQSQAQERNHDAATKLRDALGDLESADTETHLQRSADMLRRGYAPLNDDAESQIASDLKHLQDQLGQARSAMADGHAPSDDALDSVERLRSRLAALDDSMRGSAQRGAGDAANANPGEGGKNGSARQGGGNPGSPGQGGDAADGRNGALGGPQLGGRAGDVGGQRGADGRLAGPVGGAGGAYRGGPVDGAWNTGVDAGQARLPGARGSVRIDPVTIVSTPESRRVYQEGMKELTRLQKSVTDDPQARRQVDDLVRSMQRLDPRRFPGNPAMLDELYARVLSGVDRLELQLRHEPAESQPGQVRSDNPAPMPAGYQTAVAEYFRRLSKNP